MEGEEEGGGEEEERHRAEQEELLCGTTQFRIMSHNYMVSLGIIIAYNTSYITSRSISDSSLISASFGKILGSC